MINWIMWLAVIEKYTENVRFCIICNYLGKIIPALQSRCTRFRFAPLQQAQIVPRLQEIAKAEGSVFLCCNLIYVIRILYNLRFSCQLPMQLVCQMFIPEVYCTSILFFFLHLNIVLLFCVFRVHRNSHVSFISFTLVHNVKKRFCIFRIY